ncbi:hypothetical protein C8R44DRAFT_906239 [Mycena epipterygia]|nr:hypothetical protein C8R44DRAFT_906239 [Mycena epipterygia]
MLSNLWRRIFPSSRTDDPPPQRRPRKYPRTTDTPDFHHRLGDAPPDTLRGGLNIQPQFYPQQQLNPLPQFQFPPQPIQFQSQPNHPMYYGAPAGMANSWEMNNTYYPMGYPSFPVAPPNQWRPHLPNPQVQFYPPNAADFTAPNYHPTGHSGSLPLPPPAAPDVVPKPERLDAPTVSVDHSQSNTLDWPTGSVRRECIKGEGERKWKHNKWAWRSNGTVQHEGYAAEARSFHYTINRNGTSILIWEHSGDHSTHDRPPGGLISKHEEDKVDVQVLRKHEANAHELRTGDTGPGSIPLPDISATLANPRAARYPVGQSQVRLGIATGSLKGGLALMSSFADLRKRLPTAFIVDSSLSGPVYITLQTPFMDEIIRESVESWILDLAEGPNAARHGIVVDGDHSFFRQGPLLASCAFSMTSNEWVPMLYTWINSQDIIHHRPHFAHIFKAVMDFSAAQRGAHAEEYADAIISITPGFSLLSTAAQVAERRQLSVEAETAEVGCGLHFWRSGERIMKTHSLVPPASAPIFADALRELLSPITTSDRFDAVILTLKTTFPRTKNWISWWERRPIASMIFPAKSAVDREIAAQVSSTSNPIEHSHSLLHHAVGKDQELLPGIEKIYMHVGEMEKKHSAIKAGHFDASEITNRRRPQRPEWEENDGRAPDTIAALGIDPPTTSTSPSALPSDPPILPTTYSHQFLQSYPWDSPNSCFFDNGMELWFRVYARWSSTEQRIFLASLPSNSALASFFYHFDHRLKWAQSNSGIIHGLRELGLGQSNDSDTTLDVHLNFGLGHLLSGACASGHFNRVMVDVHTLLAINLFDLRITRDACGPAASLADYFIHFTPHISGGNEEGGTTLVHTLPAPFCDDLDCPPDSQPLLIETVETLWPKILQINPNCGTQPRIPIARSFNINDGTGTYITYELVGTISFNAPRKHWTSIEIIIDETMFSYDDLLHNGSLVARGPAGLICIPDPHAVFWTYNRTSEASETEKTLADLVYTYNLAVDIDSDLPPQSPGSTIVNTPPPETSKDIAPHFAAPLNPPVAPPKETVPLALNGEIPAVKCDKCGFWYHVKCVSEASPYAEPNWHAWLCNNCDALDLKPTALWNDSLIGTYVMFKTNPQSGFYPGEIASVASTGGVRVVWYEGNIYERTDRPHDKEFVTTPEECAKNAAADSEPDNVGMIKWPTRLEEDARTLHLYDSPEISDSLLHSRRSILDIIIGSTFHPIVPDYDQWMATPGELTVAKHTDHFVRKFHSTQILPGDASLIEPHTEYVMQFLSSEVDSVDNQPVLVSDRPRHRATTLAPLLFQLVVLRIYLRRSPSDDFQIYFLTCRFNKDEVKEISSADPWPSHRRVATN